MVTQRLAAMQVFFNKSASNVELEERVLPISLATGNIQPAASSELLATVPTL